MLSIHVRRLLSSSSSNATIHHHQLRTFCSIQTASESSSFPSFHPSSTNSSNATTTKPLKYVRPLPLSDSLRGDVPPNIWSKTNAQLHVTHGHPLNTIREAIEQHIISSHPQGLFQTYTTQSPIVKSTECFDDLLVPSDHISRSTSDTYYIDKSKQDVLLRTHMTAHDPYLLRSGIKAAISTGDVYRRDTIDRTHYPIFHQLDAYRLYPQDENISKEQIEQDLKQLLTNLAYKLFGNNIKTRWNNDYFPFTSPSFELEVYWNNQWLELLGCGLLHRDVLSKKCGLSTSINGWAFGLGLERIAMVLFDIPDIRLFWSTDYRFIKQFQQANLTTKFQPFSIYPSIEKHISFWIDQQDSFHENDFCQIARAVGGDLIEQVEIIDRFEKNGRQSLCYSVIFRSLHKSLTHAEINKLYDQLRKEVASSLPVTIR